jgi:hypothetical protein
MKQHDETTNDEKTDIAQKETANDSRYFHLLASWAL